MEDGVWLGEMHGRCGPHVGGRSKGIVALGLGERARTTERSEMKEERDGLPIAGELRSRTLRGWELIYIVHGMRAETAAPEVCNLVVVMIMRYYDSIKGEMGTQTN